MWLINRDTQGLDKSRIALPQVLREALIRWYVGEGTHHDEQAGVTLVQNARIGHRWIACDCLGREVAPPILTPAFLSEAETYYLRRLTSSKRPEHRADCPFFRDQVTNRISEVRSRTTPTDPPAGFFEVLRPSPEKLAQRPETDAVDDRTRNASIPRLARLLWRLMDASGVNVIAPLAARQEWSIKANFSLIGRAAAKIEMAPGIELASAFWTYARPLQTKAVYATLRRLAREWPYGHAPQGFVLLYAPGFKGQEIFVPDSEPVSIATRVQSPSVMSNPIGGPYLTLVVAGQYPEARGYAPLRAYAQPIYSGRLFVPVDSELERKALREILQIQRALHASGVDVAIRKPLFDTMTADGPCRPDFLLEARSRNTGEIRNVVVEVMGLDTEEYHASKAVTHPRMRHFGPIVALSADEITSNRGSEKLTAALDL